MKQNDFVKHRESDWECYVQSLSADDDKVDFPVLYRKLSHDLAIAKSRCYSPPLIEYLNTLLLRGQEKLYQPQNQLLQPLLSFYKTTLPKHLYMIRTYIIGAHLLFYGIGLLFFGITLWQPDFINNVIDNEQIVSLEFMYNPESDHYGVERASAGDFEMFGYYILNNISIAFQCFVGGLLLGFGAFYFLLFNALYLGTIAGHIVNIAYSSTFFSFVITHGSFELTAIVLSAAAGAVIGKHLIAPGAVSRVDALKQAGKITYPIILGCLLMLIIAAFLEAFWSSSRLIPNVVKYAVGAVCWLCILLFIFRRPAHAN